LKYLSLLLIVLSPLYADFAKLGTSGAQFLKIGVGRGAAMGEAFVAIADDASATFWNPSGLGTITQREITFQHNEWIADVRHEYLSVVLPLSNFGTMGISLTALTMGKMEILTVDDPNTSIREDTGTGQYFNASDFALAFSFGRMFTDRLAAGLSVKAVQEMIWDMSASGIAADFGIHYNTGFKGLRIAAAISNFGSDISFGGRQLDQAANPFPNAPEGEYDNIPVQLKTTPFPLPLVFRFGLAFDPIQNESSRFTVALDLNHPNDNYETLNLGLEYGYLNTVFLRLGYKAYLNVDYMKAMTGGEPIIDTTENEITGYEWGEDTWWLMNNLTAGVGFNLTSGGRLFKVDYTYMNKGVLKATHRFGLSIGF
jgi:hypothetical protein